MEYQKITNLLGNTFDKLPRFITKKWIEVHDQSGTAENRYKTTKQIRFKTPMLRSDLCDYNDAYIVVEGKITAGDPNNDAYDKTLAFKNDAPFTSCISKINKRQFTIGPTAMTAQSSKQLIVKLHAKNKKSLERGSEYNFEKVHFEPKFHLLTPIGPWQKFSRRQHIHSPKCLISV